VAPAPEEPIGPSSVNSQTSEGPLESGAGEGGGSASARRVDARVATPEAPSAPPRPRSFLSVLQGGWGSQRGRADGNAGESAAQEGLEQLATMITASSRCARTFVCVCVCVCGEVSAIRGCVGGLVDSLKN
jgi:hypothetical protein